ncbi:hypothetical protein ACNHUS_35310 [Actinomycetes bacterium M1A6_2h]
MERSSAERAMVRLMVNATRAPSELALAAVVAGLPIEETRRPRGSMDVAFPDAARPDR